MLCDGVTGFFPSQAFPSAFAAKAPSDYPEFAAFLAKAGITSISVNPDSFLSVKKAVAAVEAG